MSYAVDSKERTMLIQAERKRLDPETWQRDKDARDMDPEHKFGSFMFNSKKPIWLYAQSPNAQQKVFVQFPYYAAIRIVEGTHRLATPQEQEAFQKQQDALRAASKAQQDAEAVPGVAGLTSAIAEAMRQGRNQPANQRKE